MSSEQNTRRDFLRKATASVGLILSAPVIASIVASCEMNEKSPTTPGKTYTIDVATLSELTGVGTITVTAVSDLNSGGPVFVSWIDTATFAVFSNICTHAGCPVGLPDGPGANCVCGCHGSEFSSQDGRIVKQPSSGSATNLPTFASSYNATTKILTITG